jgi:predicted TPR repeat methyltransferase
MDLMRTATADHKAGRLRLAEAGYRAVLSRIAHAGASLLLGGVLLARCSGDDAALRAEALALARASVANVESREVVDATRILVRFGYFLLQFAGVVAIEAVDEEGGVKSDQIAGSPRPRSVDASVLAEATATLEKATLLDPKSVIAWRHLVSAYSGATPPRLVDAARAAARAVDASGGSKAPWDLHYKKGKMAKKAGDETAALMAYADAAEAAPAEELPQFWLRVALAPGGERGVSKAAIARAREVLEKIDGAGGLNEAGKKAAVSSPPEVYVRRLFDGYAAHFDKHLVQDLEYRTPERLRALAVQAATKRRSSMLGGMGGWDHLADVGCGTGLAAVAFLPHVKSASGCDVSPKMIQAARARGVYARADVADAAAWLNALAPPPDLIVAADVLVYLGDLAPLFAAARKALHAASIANAPSAEDGASAAFEPLFCASTEALGAFDATGSPRAAPDLSDVDESAMAPAGYSLTATGRCAHARAAVRRLAAEAGLAVIACERSELRQNAGVAVMGDLWAFAIQPGN